jgi:8-oxo-dGTP pyrophosphatase MutT (NUDIX family)
VPASDGSVIAVDQQLSSPPSSIQEFFAQDWVQGGDPELLFIKRAGRVGDKWSGHTALPGGKRDPEDEDDLATAIRETREEIGLDLETAHCLHAGNLPERLVSTSWGKEVLMVLCPYIFLMTDRQIPATVPQPTEVASVHWVSFRALLSPTLRTRESVDMSSRMAKHFGPVVTPLIRLTMGKMMFSAVRLLPTESVYASSIPGFIPETGGDNLSTLSGWAQAPFGVPSSSSSSSSQQTLSYQQPILLWGLTLGVLADLLDQLPPYNAVQLWKYPTFTVPDLRLINYILTRSFRKVTAEALSTGSWPSETAMDAMTEATAISTSEPPPPSSSTSDVVPSGRPASFEKNSVGIGGLGVGKDPQHAVGKLMHGYYDRVNVAIVVFLAYRAAATTGLAIWAYRLWKRRGGANL